MTDRNEHDNTSQAAVAAINRSIQAVTAEISARRNAANHADTTKRNRRFISAKAATLSEAADMSRAAVRQLRAVKARLLKDVARAEAAGFVVQEDFSVIDSVSPSTRSTRAHYHAAAIQGAVTNFVVLDRQLSSHLQSEANALKDLSDN